MSDDDDDEATLRVRFGMVVCLAPVGIDTHDMTYTHSLYDIWYSMCSYAYAVKPTRYCAPDLHIAYVYVSMSLCLYVSIHMTSSICTKMEEARAEYAYVICHA